MPGIYQHSSLTWPTSRRPIRRPMSTYEYQPEGLPPKRYRETCWTPMLSGKRRTENFVRSNWRQIRRTSDFTTLKKSELKTFSEHLSWRENQEPKRNKDYSKSWKSPFLYNGYIAKNRQLDIREALCRPLGPLLYGRYPQQIATTRDKTFWDKSRKCLFFPVILAKTEASAKWTPDFHPPLIQSCLG